MLDADTRRRIDTARDILVGKVPDPKSQVEQITIALIFKFMDDMDAQSEELGGVRKFFAGDFERYGWARLMRPSLSGYEMLGLYAEGIERMPENPGIPPLFRNIFRNAYLPYRDPETLRAFLKVMDGFSYDHSERLGDAYEYLLAVLGAQGDAGQFRTPRHIIDFIVAIVDPRKEESVLDPACGTAGFLISAYKHVLAANELHTEQQHGQDQDGQSYPARSALFTTLTPDERQRLARNYTGYDISPDMVRLSLVNMYLHGFVDPHIYEYDTLTSEERWRERADVILANPPFMSPKGGIRPHNRFAVQSKRSEVLFVDYIAEHLTPGGRAGVIVPEGIVFQTGAAYKRLREMLVKEYLVAVISLPAGVFNPYSGVKTSILILDRALARQSDTIAFFKVENDGYGLGAQRRESDKNDLPQVLAEVREYRRRLLAGEPPDDWQPTRGLVVAKERIAADGAYGLSGERYRANDEREMAYPLSELGAIILGKPQYGSGARKVAFDGTVRYVRITDLTDDGVLKSDDIVSPSVIEPDCFLEPGDLLLARSGSVGRAYLHQSLSGKYQYAGYLIRFRVDPEKALPEYVYYITRSEPWQDWVVANSKTGTLSNINAVQYAAFRLPLPPLDVQRKIVAEIEGYQRVIEGARAVVGNYRPRIAVDAEWPMVALGEVIVLEYGKPLKWEIRIDGNVPVYGSNGIVGYHNEALIEGPAIIVGRKGSAGAVNYCNSACYPIDTTFYVRIAAPDLLDLRYCYFQLCELGLDEVNAQTGVPGLNRNDVYTKLIPLPPLDVQRAIVAELEAEHRLVEGARELMTRMERRIEAVLARVWGEASAAPAEG